MFQWRVLAFFAFYIIFYFQIMKSNSPKTHHNLLKGGWTVRKRLRKWNEIPIKFYLKKYWTWRSSLSFHKLIDHQLNFMHIFTFSLKRTTRTTRLSITVDETFLITHPQHLTYFTQFILLKNCRFAFFYFFQVLEKDNPIYIIGSFHRFCYFDYGATRIVFTEKFGYIPSLDEVMGIHEDNYLWSKQYCSD